ncbi:hypothetical protein [Sphaerisporangium perillae]|uniref:hypothetical protein n=1 Tax=Sphaerisporangium perillae TaxID=2935860 RepID=UPI0020101D50|nr:hypothetical protein [Sphaerisporangium perillae]
MTDTRRTHGYTPALSLLALAGALAGVVLLAQADPGGDVELRLNISQSADHTGASPIVAP